jgi:hypothetical protein
MEKRSLSPQIPHRPRLTTNLTGMESLFEYWMMIQKKSIANSSIRVNAFWIFVVETTTNLMNFEEPSTHQ